MNDGHGDPDEPGDVLLVQRAASYEPKLSCAGAARRLLTDALETADRPQWADAGALALSELVTNVALHAHTRFDVLIRVHAAHLSVEVRDGNPALPRDRRYDMRATTGRGLALVAAVTRDCGVRSLGSEGKVVWFWVGDEEPEQSADELLGAWDVDGAWDVLEHTPSTREVTLCAMPATLWLAARQHHDAILRELVLYAAEHDDAQASLELADTARGLVSRAVQHAVEQAQAAGTARSAVPAGHPAPLPPVPESLLLTVTVPADIGPAYAALQDALDVGERLATAGKLLARPGLPEIVAVRTWVCEQVLSQLAELPATPWPGTAQRHFETAVNDIAHQHPWDDTSVRDSELGVIAADDANRIVAVSRPLARLLGWDVDDLVGRRVVTLIPHRMREAHVAGFSRVLTTGEAHILGVPLVLPVLHADGRELPCRFLVERAPHSSARSVYLAWIEADLEP